MSIVDSSPTVPPPSDPEPAALPLTAVHQELGARLAPQSSAALVSPLAAAPLVPMSYGSTADEYAALRQGCGLADRSGAGRMEMAGADRLRFLHAYVTCEVKALAAGQGAYGFFTSPQGRILADVVVSAQADRLWLELPAGHVEVIASHLRKYLIADRVEMRPLPQVPLTLAGPRAAAVLAGKTSGVEVPAAPWSHVPARVAGVEVRVQRTGRLGVPAFTIWVDEQEAAAVWRELLAGGAARPVGQEALELVRTEAGLARFGHEFGPQSFPQETGAEAEAVSYTKGCYLGQEVVARIHYRGGVQKSLCGLLFAGSSRIEEPQESKVSQEAQGSQKSQGSQGSERSPRPESSDPASLPPPGTPLLFEGREAGNLGTAVYAPALQRPIGLAILHRRAATPGSRLEVGESGAAVAEVVALPFLSP